MSDDASIANRKSQIANLLSRPSDQRLREYKYRFAQSAVFGLPVIGLQYFGLRLGGAEAAVWVGLLQALLAGWILYIAAAGMLFEGLLLIRKKITPDLMVALLSAGLYLASAIGLVLLLFQFDLERRIFWFHASVMLLILWCGIQWRRCGAHCNKAGQPPVSASRRE